MDAGDANRNRQRLVRKTTRRSTAFAGQRVWVMHCEDCGQEYGCNGCDAHVRRCPACQGGRQGEPFDRDDDNVLETIRRQLREGSDEARASFLAVYESRIDNIALILVSGVEAFDELNRYFDATRSREKRLMLAGFYFWSALHYLASAAEFLIAGHPLGAGNQFRSATEAVAIALLLSHPDTGVFEQHEDGTLRAHRATRKLEDHAEKFGDLFVENGAERYRKMAATFHEESHASRLATAHLISYSRDGRPILGGDYDPQKEHTYVRQLNHIEGLATNVVDLLSGFLKTLRRHQPPCHFEHKRDNGSTIEYDYDRRSDGCFVVRRACTRSADGTRAWFDLPPEGLEFNGWFALLEHLEREADAHTLFPAV